MLNGADGLTIVETLRREGDRTPVLVISALSSVDERISGLKAGGDDYLVKPFDVRELSARIEALLRRGFDARADPAESRRSGNGPGRSHGALRGPTRSISFPRNSNCSNISCVVPTRS